MRSISSICPSSARHEKFPDVLLRRAGEGDAALETPLLGIELKVGLRARELPRAEMQAVERQRPLQNPHPRPLRAFGIIAFEGHVSLHGFRKQLIVVGCFGRAARRWRGRCTARPSRRCCRRRKGSSSSAACRSGKRTPRWLTPARPVRRWKRRSRSRRRCVAAALPSSGPPFLALNWSS